MIACLAEPATVRRDQQSEPGSFLFIAQNNLLEGTYYEFVVTNA
jgi:hypothetical protein